MLHVDESPTVNEQSTEAAHASATSTIVWVKGTKSSALAKYGVPHAGSDAASTASALSSISPPAQSVQPASRSPPEKAVTAGLVYSAVVASPVEQANVIAGAPVFDVRHRDTKSARLTASSSGSGTEIPAREQQLFQIQPRRIWWADHRRTCALHQPLGGPVGTNYIISEIWDCP